MPVLNICPCCGSVELQNIYQLSNVPVHSVQLIYDQQSALDFPRGEIHLVFCRTCGFIFNQAFDPAMEDYSLRYESTQAFSPVFNAFADRLARGLVERYDLHHKKIVEIGCGQGEFLSLLCELGENEGVGLDPAYVEGRLQSPARERMAFIPDYYSEKYAGILADFYCCKMTLEHIQDAGSFIASVRRTLEQQRDAVVFFQIPSAPRILEEVAFWDIYYEHCSYYSQGSLARLFRRNGFDILDLWTDYNDQYLMITAKPGDGKGTPMLPQEDDLGYMSSTVNLFASQAPERMKEWQRRIKAFYQDGCSVILWGSGSKGVAFLTTLGLREEIAFCVDQNPLKENTFMAATGQRVVLPNALQQQKPGVVIVMNPIYIEEVQCRLDQFGLSPIVLGVS